ncbi:predicted protein [Sclerotinia sclerotiorum 1980 UF-70]|uniref:Uncharacterized protein n=1 Tax=Sclerotinia sclerotiorum (strain ATCC 18683 / 1980 / Ss-1) TaxID=665079 RepID=A7F195_SCLS1|nr:predicted protein [Sclerotinia sclerotiorum 1980 UF-70]EDN95487.1 predicted protein [Sclerotinia sclerotiorum 1980 UF-70]
MPHLSATVGSYECRRSSNVTVKQFGDICSDRDKYVKYRTREDTQHVLASPGNAASKPERLHAGQKGKSPRQSKPGHHSGAYPNDWNFNAEPSSSSYSN